MCPFHPLPTNVPSVFLSLGSIIWQTEHSFKLSPHCGRFPHRLVGYGVLHEIVLAPLQQLFLLFQSMHIFPTNRTARRGHIVPMRRFVESVFDQDLREFAITSCFEVQSTCIGMFPVVMHSVLYITTFIHL